MPVKRKRKSANSLTKTEKSASKTERTQKRTRAKPREKKTKKSKDPSENITPISIQESIDDAGIVAALGEIMKDIELSKKQLEELSEKAKSE